MQIMNFYFIRNGQGKNSLLTKHHLYSLDLISGKLYFREAMVSLLPFYFFNFYRGEDLLLFTGAWHFVES